MRNTMISLALMLGLGTGCSAAKGALGALSPKPTQVTVVNNLEVKPAPVQVVATPVATVADPAPRKKHRRLAALKAAVSGAVAGALLGTAIGYTLDGAEGAGKGAAVGAGAGAVGGTLAHGLDRARM